MGRGLRNKQGPGWAAAPCPVGAQSPEGRPVGQSLRGPGFAGLRGSQGEGTAGPVGRRAGPDRGPCGLQEMAMRAAAPPPAGVQPEWHLMAAVALTWHSCARATQGSSWRTCWGIRTDLSRAVSGGAMAAVWSARVVSRHRGAGGGVPRPGLSPSFPPGHGHTPVPIPGPASAVSPRPGDPQWLLPRRPAGKRPGCRAQARAPGDWSPPRCPWAAFPSDRQAVQAGEALSQRD